MKTGKMTGVPSSVKVSNLGEKTKGGMQGMPMAGCSSGNPMAKIQACSQGKNGGTSC